MLDFIGMIVTAALMVLVVNALSPLWTPRVSPRLRWRP